MKSIRKLATIVCSIVLALFLLSASIACPILIREFYYMQIQTQNLEERTGYSEETIREAYDEMMDYIAGGGETAGKTFGTGALAWSESGKAHFDDVEHLFRLDFWVLGVSGGLLLLYLIACMIAGIAAKKNPDITRSDVLHPWRILHRGPLFWGPVGLITVFGITGLLAARDFDQFFVTFHHLFFPGKENWIFDYKKDAIINVLPQEVFQTFALILLAILTFLCLLCILADIILERKKKAA